MLKKQYYDPKEQILNAMHTKTFMKVIMNNDSSNYKSVKSNNATKLSFNSGNIPDVIASGISPFYWQSPYH